MKLQIDSLTAVPDFSGGFRLPAGVVGFTEYTEAALLDHPEHMPFRWLRLQGPPGCINFLVIQPGRLVPSYLPELFDADAEALGLADPSEAVVLTIITMRPGAPVEATVNLIGPIVVNRRTHVGRQLVIANYAKFRARHPLRAHATVAA